MQFSTLYYYAALLSIRQAKRAKNDVERFGWIAVAYANISQGVKLRKAGM